MCEATHKIKQHTSNQDFFLLIIFCGFKYTLQVEFKAISQGESSRQKAKAILI